MTRDLRKYARQTNIRLLVGGIIVLVIVGEGLIYLIYGENAAITGLVCMFAGLLPLLFIWVILTLIGWVVKISAE